MPFPPNGPATVAATKIQLGITDNDDDVRLTSIVAAVNTVVLGLPVATVADTTPPAADWTGQDLAHIVEGANMLGARLFRRKNSPDGVSAFGASGPIYVQRNDPDIAMLLQIGAHTKPAVG